MLQQKNCSPQAAAAAKILISISRNKALTSEFSALTSESCTFATLQNAGNTLLFTANGGEQFTLLDGATIDVYCTNANLITVKGTGTLSYLVHKYQ